MTARTTKVGGATVTIDPSPSQQLAASAEPLTLEDSTGRVFTLKKPGVLAQFRIVEALGETAMNQVYMGMVLPLLFVSAIDGEPVPTPGSKGEVEALIKRLDEPGIEAVMTAVQKHFAGPTEDAAKNV